MATGTEIGPGFKLEAGFCIIWDPEGGHLHIWNQTDGYIHWPEPVVSFVVGFVHGEFHLVQLAELLACLYGLEAGKIEPNPSKKAEWRVVFQTKKE